VALPIPSPSRPESPSLIPLDVLHQAEQEAAEEVSGEDLVDMPFERGGLGDDVPILVEVPAGLLQAVEALASVALFRGLEIEPLAEGASFIEVPDGEVLFEEGEPATAFFVVTQGTFEVVRRREGRELAVRHEHKGAALGLYGLFSAQRRVATARAIGDSTVLVIPAERLQALSEEDDALNDRLLRFYRERLIESFVGQRLFTDIDTVGRSRLSGSFGTKHFERGDTLLNQGEVSNLIGLVSHGKLMLEMRGKAGAEPTLLDVTPGQFIVSLGALSGLPNVLRVFAPAAASVELISHKAFAELLAEYPALRGLGKRLPQYGRQFGSAVFCGSAGVPGL
jgi:CRP-like cAMP-binding protein